MTKPIDPIKRELSRKKNEPMAAMEAFEIYYALGDNRTHADLASKVCLPQATTKRWAKIYNWDQLILERNKEIIAQISAKRKARLIAAKERQIDMLVSMVEDTMVEQDDGTIKSRIQVSDVQDLERTVKLLNLQSGDPTERPEGGAAPVIQFILKNTG